MTNFDRMEVFERLRTHNLAFLTEVGEKFGGSTDGLNNHAVCFQPLLETGSLWDDFSWDGSLNGVPSVHNIDDCKVLRFAYLEKGTPFMDKSFLADIVTEIQMMLPEVRVTIAPKLKLEYVHSGDNPYDITHLLKWDDTLGLNCHYEKFCIHRGKKEIIIATSYDAQEVMRAAYQAVWDMVSSSIWPQWVSQAEMDRAEKVASAEVLSLAVAIPLHEYESELRNAQPDLNGNFSTVVQDMIHTAGTGFVNYMINLRLLHAVPYIFCDEDSDEMVYPRFADLYHRIINGDGGAMIREHKRFLVKRGRNSPGGNRQAA